MKTVKITDQSSVREVLPDADEQDVVVIQDGHPVALVTPFDEDDLEWYAREGDPEFAKSIRRALDQVARGETVSEEELDRILSDKLDGIDLTSFSSPVSVETLQRTNCDAVPRGPGVYVILYPKQSAPEFLGRSVGGWFKGQDPSDPAEFIREHWVDGASVVYIGKGEGATGLQQRLRQLMQFGQGKPAGHRGGRLLWNLRNNRQLFVRWRETGNANAAEVRSELIRQFREAKGANPFANLND